MNVSTNIRNATFFTVGVVSTHFLYISLGSALLTGLGAFMIMFASCTLVDMIFGQFEGENDDD